jgi:hypothetical protein
MRLRKHFTVDTNCERQSKIDTCYMELLMPVDICSLFFMLKKKNNRNIARVISARDMTQKEKRYYQKNDIN